jgi:hypothetical protein
MKMKSILSVAVLTLAIGLTYTACGGGGGSDSIPGGSVKVVGRLIDLTTRAPICRGDSSSNCATDGGTAVADVRVGVRVGDEVKECDIADKNKTSTDATGSKDNLFNEAGYFSCDVGLANVYELRAAATGYASYGLVFSPATFDNNGGNAQAAAKIQDLGNIRLSKGVDVTVNVVDAQTGAAITGATVYAGLGIA